ncbi:MAG: NAD-dependent epimerase/dehydratase family protein [Acetobacteraceae bacterium]
MERALGIYTITGGAGFIGSHLADSLLAGGHAVRIVDDFSTGKTENIDPRCDVMRGDVCDARVIRRALLGASGCFHLAAIASVARANEDWMGTHRVNLGGTISVLDAARAMGGLPVVYASSAAVYGRVEGVADETSTTAPLTAYGADKRGSELHAAAGTLVHGVPTLGFRFFNVYGPRQDPDSPYSGVISIFAKILASGRPVTIHGDGQQTRDLIFVADLVRFLRAGMEALTEGRNGAEALSGTVLNACTGRETSVIDMAHIIGELLGSAIEVCHGPVRAGDIRRSVGSPSLAAATLGVSATTTLREGLAKTLESLDCRPNLLWA